MREHHAWIRLDRYTGILKGPARSQPVQEASLVEAARFRLAIAPERIFGNSGIIDGIFAAESLEESVRCLERVTMCGEAVPGQKRRDNAALGGATRMQRLRHLAEIAANAGTHAGREAKRASHLLLVEAEQT